MTAGSEPPGWDARCLRCESGGDLDMIGCAPCAEAGFGAPVVPVRRHAADVTTGTGVAGPTPTASAGALAGTGAMWRWAPLLVPVGEPVSLGEGGTPLVELARTGLPGRVLLKDERANPTGSFKDRLASAAVSWARHRGAGTVAVASSGNAGIAAAAYAAAAGLRCVVLSTRTPPDPTVAALDAFGARLLLTATSPERWTALRTGVDELGWFPLTNYRDPPVASHPVGVHGYHTIAYEIAEALSWRVPDWVVVPTSRGDGLFGIWAGFAELAELGWTASVPRMLAVERFPSLSGALARDLEQPEPVPGDERPEAGSIGNRRATLMSLYTLRRSGGTAVCCDDGRLWSAWRWLAARGTLLELSSAAALAGVGELAARSGLSEAGTVVLLGTAGPYAQATLAGRGAGRTVADPRDAAHLNVLSSGGDLPG